jgi:DUF971 family protein
MPRSPIRDYPDGALPHHSESPHGRTAYDRSVTATPGAPSASPTAIHADRTAGTLDIEWADGHRSTFDTTTLRWLCPCAFCRGEAGLPGWLDTGPTLSPEQTRLVDVALVGGYALAPTWGDGHHTGYYTYAMLRERCPCPACTARRDAAAASVAVTDRHEEHA